MKTKLPSSGDAVLLDSPSMDRRPATWLTVLAAGGFAAAVTALSVPPVGAFAGGMLLAAGALFLLRSRPSEPVPVVAPPLEPPPLLAETVPPNRLPPNRPSRPGRNPSESRRCRAASAGR